MMIVYADAEDWQLRSGSWLDHTALMHLIMILLFPIVEWRHFVSSHLWSRIQVLSIRSSASIPIPNFLMQSGKWRSMICNLGVTIKPHSEENLFNYTTTKHRTLPEYFSLPSYRMLWFYHYVSKRNILKE